MKKLKKLKDEIRQGKESLPFWLLDCAFYNVFLHNHTCTAIHHRMSCLWQHFTLFLGLLKKSRSTDVISAVSRNLFSYAIFFDAKAPKP